MKKIAISLFILIQAIVPIMGQGCLSDGITFTSQSEIDSFSINHPNCTHILGDVTVQIPSITQETNLDGLSQIVRIDGSLTVRAKCPNYFGLHNIVSIGKNLVLNSSNKLISTAELGSLKYVGGDLDFSGVNDVLGFTHLDTIYGKLMVRFSNLKDFEGLDSLAYVQKYIWISNCDSLESLYGLHNLRVVEEGFNLFGTPACPLNSLEHLGSLQKINGRFAVESLPHLKDLTGLTSLVHVAEFSTAFSHFESLDGLQGITEAAVIKIGFSPHIKRLTGLENLTRVGELSISGCDSIIDLSGLNSLQKVDDLLVYSNENLINLTGLENLDTISNDVRIHKNPRFESFEGFHSKSILGGIWLRLLPELKDFSSLCCLDQIAEILSILETGISSLAGLEGIESLGTLRLGSNSNLQSLTGLENLETLKFLYLMNNEVLSDIGALRHTNPDSIAKRAHPTITITDNPVLSNCSIEPICRALEDIDLVSQIENNLTFCSTRDSVLIRCNMTTTGDVSTMRLTRVYPNPFTQSIWVDSESPQVLLHLNPMGHVMKKYSLIRGVTELEMEDIPPGMYFLKSENGKTIKIIKM